MKTGIVKCYFADRGFGFIKPDDGAADIFVGDLAIKMSGLGTLKKGDRISFAVEPDKQGRPRASNLSRAGVPHSDADVPVRFGRPVGFY